jgi:hypothetical protein
MPETAAHPTFPPIERATEGPQRSRYEITLPHHGEGMSLWYIIERSPAGALAGDDWDVIASARTYHGAVAILEALQVTG